MVHNHLYMHMCGMHISVFRIETNPVPELCVRRVCEVCVCMCVSVWCLCVLECTWPDRQAEECWILSLTRGGRAGMWPYSSLCCDLQVHTSGWLHFQFRAQFHSFTRTCLLAVGVEASFCTPMCAYAQKSLDFPLLIVHFSCTFCVLLSSRLHIPTKLELARFTVFPLQPVKITTQVLL